MAGRKDFVSNDLFCSRFSKACDVIVIAIGYHLAPENKFTTTFDDGSRLFSGW